MNFISNVIIVGFPVGQVLQMPFIQPAMGLRPPMMMHRPLIAAPGAAPGGAAAAAAAGVQMRQLGMAQAGAQAGTSALGAAATFAPQLAQQQVMFVDPQYFQQQQQQLIHQQQQLFAYNQQAMLVNQLMVRQIVLHEKERRIQANPRMMQIPSIGDMSTMAQVATSAAPNNQAASAQAAYPYGGVVPSGATYASPSVSYAQQAVQQQQQQQQTVSGSTGVYQSRYAPYSKK